MKEREEKETTKKTKHQKQPVAPNVMEYGLESLKNALTLTVVLSLLTMIMYQVNKESHQNRLQVN